MLDAFNPWMITFLFEVNPVSFDQKQFPSFAPQKDMNEMAINDFFWIYYFAKRSLPAF